MYMSRGTVRATIRSNGENWDRRVYFIPTPDYYVKHESKQFAVFVSKSEEIHHVGWQVATIRFLLNVRNLSSV